MSIQSDFNRTLMTIASLATSINAMDELDKMTNGQKAKVGEFIEESDKLRDPTYGLSDIEDIKISTQPSPTSLGEWKRTPAFESKSERKIAEKALKIQASGLEDKFRKMQGIQERLAYKKAVGSEGVNKMLQNQYRDLLKNRKSQSSVTETKEEVIE
jgi:hypothetical protein